MNTEQLQKTVADMMAPGKGILAADESNGTAGKRLSSVGVENNEENRRLYRELFLGTEGAGEYLSGVILYDETMHQKSNDGTPYPELLESKGIVPGIKVDKSTIPFPGFENEVVTEGLDGLKERMEEYREMGARFAKWRAVIRIGDGIPTPECIHTNAIILARYARICQEAGIVPMVEPEVLLKGSHSFGKAEGVTQRTLEEVMYQMKRYRVDLSGAILKTSMVVPGAESGEVVSSDDIGKSTLSVLNTAVPKELGGIVFLSGGQNAEEATANLNEVNKRADDDTPWEITFSFARAIQGPALEEWRGKEENVEEARKVFMKRLRLNSEARKGNYQDDLEQDAS